MSNLYVLPHGLKQQMETPVKEIINYTSDAVIDLGKFELKREFVVVGLLKKPNTYYSGCSNI